MLSTSSSKPHPSICGLGPCSAVVVSWSGFLHVWTQGFGKEGTPATEWAAAWKRHTSNWQVIFSIFTLYSQWVMFINRKMGAHDLCTEQSQCTPAYQIFPLLRHLHHFWTAFAGLTLYSQFSSFQCQLANFAASVRLLQMTNFQWGTGAKGNFLEFPSAKKGVDTRA